MLDSSTVIEDTDGTLTIRRLGPADADALERLAQRDSARVPGGTVYAAVAGDGSILAAISLESRALVADPFRSTAHAAEVLRILARRLRDGAGVTSARSDIAIATPARGMEPGAAQAGAC
jgi:hypothetical protein